MKRTLLPVMLFAAVGFVATTLRAESPHPASPRFEAATKEGQGDAAADSLDAQANAPQGQPRPCTSTESPGRAPAKVRLQVENVSGYAERAVPRIREVTARLVEHAGVQVAADARDYEATLRIAIEQGEGSGDKYERLGFCYTGAKIGGTLSYEVENAEPVRKSFQGEYPAPPFLLFARGPNVALPRCPKELREAPFEDAFYSSDLFAGLADVISEKYGPDARLCLWLAAVDEDFFLRRQAIKALGELRDSRGAERLLREVMMEAPPARVAYTQVSIASTEDLRQAAADALVKIGAPGVDGLLTALNSPNADVRRLAAKSLGEIGDKRAVAALTERLSDAERTVQLWSAFALFKLGDTQKLDLLAAGLDDANDKWHTLAAQLLGETGDSRAVGPLVASLQRQTPKRKYDYAVIQALMNLTKQDLGFEPKKWIQWWGRQQH